MEIFLHAKYLYPLNKYRFYIKTALLLLLLSPFTSLAQTAGNLSGKVVDATTKQAIPGAIVNIKGEKLKTTTNINGEFNFSNQAIPATLQVSFIGYDKTELSVTANATTIELKPSLNQLNDVVVVGYGTQKKGDLTSSVSEIKASEVTKTPVASFDGQLQGKASGVQISTASGIPGEGIFVRVRGTTSINSSNDPLYVVDGVFLNNTSLQTLSLGGRTTSPLADINPADIESIVILKDAASTAIYGTRGANGVVLVTTKHGAYNDKIKVTLDASSGWVEADPKTVPKMATGPEMAELANEYWINSGIDNPSLNQTYANRPFRPVTDVINGSAGKGNPEDQQTYDRIDDILQKGLVQDYNLAIQGGSNKSRVYFGAGYTDQEALIKVPTFQRASLKFNYDQKLNDNISFGVSNNLSRSYRNQAFTGDGPNVNLWNAATSAATYTPKYAEDGTSTGADNIYVLMANYNVRTISLRYIGSVYGEAKLAKGLTFRSTFSMDYDHYDEGAYWNSQTSIGKAANGDATSAITQNSTWINEQTLSYQKDFSNNHFTAVLGNSFQSSLDNVTSAEGKGFANDKFQDISSASTVLASQTSTKNNLASFFGKVDYNYANRYYFGASFRGDGSSKFAPGHQWGYFPALSAGWRINDEAFLKNINWLSDLKLRASYGITGNQSGIPNYASMGLWSGSNPYADSYGSPQPGIGPYQLGNNILTWEQTAQTDIGLDIGLFNNRVSVTLDVYNKYTKDLLLLDPIIASSGYPNVYNNDGEMSNRGYEVGINSTNIITNDFSWKTNINFAGNRNRIEKLATPITAYSRDWVIMQQGYSMNSFWLYDQLSVNPHTGAPVFKGQAADGSVTVADRQIMGNAYPKIYGGVNNTFTYKNFDLSFLFTFQYGNKAINLNRYFRERNPSSGGIDTKALDRWTHDGQITDIPRFTSVGTNYTIDNSSRYLEDASFLRLKLLTFGYNLPKSVSSKLKLNNVRLYFVGSNLLLFTKYTGDPESSVTSNPNSQALGSFGVPPQPRGFQFGLNVTF